MESQMLKIEKLILILIAGILLTSSTSIPLANAHPTQTSLTIAVPSPPPETPQESPQEYECTIEATLKDENGNPLPDMAIRFWVWGTNNIDNNIGIVKTNSTGVASLKYTPFEAYLNSPPRTGTYKVHAVFSGTTSYAQSSSSDVYVVFIFRDYTSYIVGDIVGGGIIAVAVIGYIVFRRRKKAITCQ